MNFSKKIVIIIHVILLQYILTTTQSRAENIIYSNNFESDQENTFPSGWVEKRNYQWGNYSKKCMNGQNEASWKIINYTGNKKLQISIDGPSCVMDLVPENFIIPDVTNYQFDLDVDFPDNVFKDRNLAFRFQQPDRWYGIKLTNPNIIEFEKINLSGYNHFGNAYYSKGFSPNNTYHLTFKITNNLLQFYINNELVHQALDQDPILETGTISLKGSIGTLGPTTTYFDNIVVTDLSSQKTILNVPFFSQQDPVWANVVYDSANKWANPDYQGIKNWGCAITSATMILNYHGISNNPSGSATTPQTLNQYLKDNDGYSLKGHLIWPSIVEYANKSIQSGQLSSDAKSFDFLYETYNKDSVINDLKSEKSGIVRIVTDPHSTTTVSDDSTHFVVAKGYDSSNNIYIADPMLLTDDNPKINEAYANKQFTKYARFMPFTQPSYLWVFVHDDKNQAWIEHNNNKLGIKNGIEYNEINNGIFNLESVSGGESTTPMTSSWQYAIPKPPSGSYTLNITSPTQLITPLEIFAYDNNSNHQKLSKEILVSQNFTRVITINYDNTNAQNSSISVISSYASLKESVKYASNQKWIHPILEKHFLMLIDMSEKLSEKHNKSCNVLLKVLDQQLDMAFHRRKIAKAGYVLIQSELKGLMHNK